MKCFVRSRVISFRVFFPNTEGIIALFAIIKVKALIAFVPYICYRFDTASIAFYLFFLSLARLDNKFNTMFFCVVPSDLQTLIGSSEVAVLTYAKMRAIRANKAGSYDRFHITTRALILTVCR